MPRITPLVRAPFAGPLFGSVRSSTDWLAASATLSSRRGAAGGSGSFRTGKTEKRPKGLRPVLGPPPASHKVRGMLLVCVRLCAFEIRTRLLTGPPNTPHRHATVLETQVQA